MNREEIRELLKSNLEYFADNPDQLNGVIMNIEAGFDRYAYAVALSAMPEESKRILEQDELYELDENIYSEAFNDCRETFLANIKAKTNQ